MLIIPAIDIKKDKIVRLYKGNFEKVSFYQENIEDLVTEYIVKGVERIHVVILLGAKYGRILKKENQKIEKIIKVRDYFGKEKCKIQLGGGIRTYSQIKYFIEKGIDYLILSTALLIPLCLEEGFSINNIKELYQKVGKTFNLEKEVPELELIDILTRGIKEKIIVAIDCKKEEIGLSGWEVTFPLLPEYVIKKFWEKGFKNFLITDIEQDGTLGGIRKDFLFKILEKIYTSQIKPEIFISGGISSEEDIDLLTKSIYPIKGVIIGKALFQKKLDLKNLIKKFQPK